MLQMNGFSAGQFCTFPVLMYLTNPPVIRILKNLLSV